MAIEPNAFSILSLDHLNLFSSFEGARTADADFTLPAKSCAVLG
jgi:hypothetical protein